MRGGRTTADDPCSRANEPHRNDFNLWLSGCVLTSVSFAKPSNASGKGQSLVAKVMGSVIESGNPNGVETTKASAGGYMR